MRTFSTSPSPRTASRRDWKSILTSERLTSVDTSSGSPRASSSVRKMTRGVTSVSESASFAEGMPLSSTSTRLSASSETSSTFLYRPLPSYSSTPSTTVTSRAPHPTPAEAISSSPRGSSCVPERQFLMASCRASAARLEQCSNLAADALHDAIKNWRSGTQLEPLGEEEIASAGVGCGARDVTVVEGVDEYEGKGLYKKVEDVSELADKRVLVLDKGIPSAKLALSLTEVTPRVIFLTELDALGLPDEVSTEVKRSDVKMLFQSRLLAVRGEGEVEKVLILDLDDDDEYELFVDAVVLLER